MTHGVDFNPGLSHVAAKAAGSMGLTAELLATQFGITREEQDKFALRSHQRAVKATKEGRFKDEIVPVSGHDENGVPYMVTQDEVQREDANLEALGKLKPIFNPRGGSVTAGNASALSDGASCLLVMSEEKAKELGLKPMAYVKSMASAYGVYPIL